MNVHDLFAIVTPSSSQLWSQSLHWIMSETALPSERCRTTSHAGPWAAWARSPGPTRTTPSASAATRNGPVFGPRSSAYRIGRPPFEVRRRYQGMAPAVNDDHPAARAGEAVVQHLRQPT